MKVKKKKYDRPWLTPTGVEIPSYQLRRISKSWNITTWGSYLDWFGTGRNAALITPDAYDRLCEKRIESIFEEFAQNDSQENRTLCEQFLAKLPPLEAEVLRRVFLAGNTEVEIAFALKRSQPGINLIKNRALSRLKRGNSGESVIARRFMRGEDSFSESEEPSIWNHSFTQPIKEARAYGPKNHKAEFKALSPTCLRVALQALSESAQRILYLRHWCDFSVKATSRALGIAMNNVEQIESASISKVKRSALEFELGITLGGSQCI